MVCFFAVQELADMCGEEVLKKTLAFVGWLTEKDILETLTAPHDVSGSESLDDENIDVNKKRVEEFLQAFEDSTEDAKVCATEVFTSPYV
jgi:hypothetical protein